MMLQAVKEQSSYRSSYSSLQEYFRQAFPSWVVRLQQNALEAFESLGFPTPDQEDWKYTNLAPLARSSFYPAAPETEYLTHGFEIEGFIAPEAADSHIAIIDGAYSPDRSRLSALPEGVAIVDLAGAFDSGQGEIVRRYLGRAVDYQESALAALNTAFLGLSGVLVYIPKNVKVRHAIQLLFLSTEESEDRALFPRVLVVAERGSEATLIQSHSALSKPSYFCNAVVEAFISDDARLAHYNVQRESERAFHIAETRAQLGRNSSYDLTTVTLGARLCRQGINIALENEGAECWVDGLYITASGQHADTHSLIDHQSPHCTSHQLYKGILDGKSRAVFNGRIYVHRDAQRTDAMQTNKNLLLSNDARVDTKPQLEIFADDVKCTHGATVGQLDPEELFYLLTRGLNANTARNLLTYGFAEEVVKKIKIDSIRAELDRTILSRLQPELAEGPLSL